MLLSPLQRLRHQDFKYLVRIYGISRTFWLSFVTTETVSFVPEVPMKGAYTSCLWHQGTLKLDQTADCLLPGWFSSDRHAAWKDSVCVCGGGGVDTVIIVSCIIVFVNLYEVLTEFSARTCL